MDEEFSVAIAEYSYSNEQLAFILFFLLIQSLLWTTATEEVRGRRLS